MSEDDVRTKVVYSWLVGWGFAPSEISVEYGFEIKLGRSAYRIGSHPRSPSSARAAAAAEGTIARPRADLLVRRGGRNLLVVEVKAPDEPLDDEARDQGISYARLLPQMAPFVVVTNGHETKIFDTISRESLQGESIPPNHPGARPGFRVTADEFALRAEAMELFISLCPENLLAFCERQVEYRMSRLRSDDPSSGKKYVPTLYVERSRPKADLRCLLDREKKRVVIVTGRPQVGKTSFICHFVESLLRSGRPCLFYPAISLHSSLLQEIGEDFGWIVGDVASPSVLVAKLAGVLRRASTPLILFIEGWNEADTAVARAIDRDCERLPSERIQIVLSFTHSAATRLLIERGNPSFIAEETSIGKGGAGLVEIDPEAVARQPAWSAVAIGPYDASEREIAYAKYAACHRVVVPEGHPLVGDPFLLSVAMRRYAGGTLPLTLDEPALIESWLLERIDRTAQGMEGLDVADALTELGRAMQTRGAPLGEMDVKKVWRLPAIRSIPDTFFDAALLAPQGRSSPGRLIDFYNSRDRDYVIACWSGRWDEKLGNPAACWAELASATCSEAGCDALVWFFRQPAFLGRILAAERGVPAIVDPKLRRIFIAAAGDLARQAFVNSAPLAVSGGEEVQTDKESPHPIWSNPDLWITYATGVALHDPVKRIRIEAVKLLASLVDDHDALRGVLPGEREREDFLAGLLEIHRDYPLRKGEVSQVVLDLFRSLHWDEVGAPDDESSVVGVLHEAAESDSTSLREAAFSCWGYVAPRSFLLHIGGAIRGGPAAPEWIAGLRNTASELAGEYYGDICPGRFYAIEDDPEAIVHECVELNSLAEPLYSSAELSHAIGPILELLDDLVGKLRGSQVERLPLPLRDHLLRDTTEGSLGPRLPDAPGQLHLFE